MSPTPKPRKRLSTMSEISGISRSSRLTTWSERIDQVMDDYIVGIAPMPVPIIEIIKEQPARDHIDPSQHCIPDDWKISYLSRQINKFKCRSHTPGTDAEGYYGSDAADRLFVVVNDQVDGVDELVGAGAGGVDAKRDKEVMRVVGECLGVMKSMQELWSSTIDLELKRHKDKYPASSRSKSATSARQTFVAHVICVANDMVKCAEYLESLWGRVKPMVFSRADRNTIDEWMIATIEGYINLSRQCVTVLITVVLITSKPSLDLLFQQQWYKGGVMGIITKHMEEALNPIQTFLNSTLLEVLLHDLIEAFLASYLSRLANPYHKIRIPSAVQMMKEDVRVSFQFFAGLKPAEDEFDIMDTIIGMMEVSDPESILASYWTFAKMYGPNLAFVERILRARDDLDNSKVNSVMRALTKKVKDDRMSSSSYGIMKKVVLPTRIEQLRRSSLLKFVRSRTVKF